MTIPNLPKGRLQFFDANGSPLARGTVTYYVPSTTTLATTYQDINATIPNTNPVLLDSNGSCVVFASGIFREYVQDFAGNVLSDSVVLAASDTLLSLGVSAAMLPVVGAPTIAAAEALLLGGGSNTAGHLSLNPGDQTLTVAPTANPSATLASLNVQGTTINAAQREFLVNLGLNATVGTGHVGGSPGGINPDKVTLYTGLTAQPGTSDVWTQNSCLTMQPGSGSYNAQGYELDFNNLNANRGANGNLSADFSAPIAVGLGVTGAGGLFTSTSAVTVNSQSPTAIQQWARGITIIGETKFANIHDWCKSPVGIQFDNVYAIAAINLTAVNGNAGGFTSTALLMKNAQAVTWQNADASQVISDSVDSNNNRVIGLGSTPNATSGIIMGAPTLPLTTGMDLGGSNNHWGQVFAQNVRLTNNTVLSWDNAAHTGFVFDYVDSINNRVVGSGAQTVYMTTTTAPITPNIDLGTAVNYWGNIYSINGVVTPSDIRLKHNIVDMPESLAAVNAMRPIAFNWQDADASPQTQFGFDADDVIKHMATLAPNNAVSEIVENGTKFLRKDQLIAVLVKALQEISSKVDSLQAQIDAHAPTAKF